MALLRSRAAGAPTADGDGVPEVRTSPRCAEELIDSLRSGSTEAERREAALDLAAVPAAEEPLANALAQEAAPRVREAIFIALVAMNTEAAACALGRFITSEDVALRNAAVEALQQIGKAGAAVESLLTSADPDVRIFAVNVLEGLRYPGASESLHALLDGDPDINVGLAAVEALAQFGDPNDVEALQNFARRFSEEPFVRFAVDLACRRVVAGGSA